MKAFELKRKEKLVCIQFLRAISYSGHFLEFATKALVLACGCEMVRFFICFNLSYTCAHL